jgi:type I restriction enzyme, S subunit
MAVATRQQTIRAGYKQTEVGVIPSEWNVQRLGDLGSWRGGTTPSMRNSAYWSSGTVPWAASGDIRSTLLSDTSLKITDAALKQASVALLPPNSILIVTRSGILRKYLPVAKNIYATAINQDIKALRPDTHVSADYLLHVLVAQGRRILARCLKAGTTVESIDSSWLKAYEVPIPSLPEQCTIAEVLSDADVLIAALDQLIAKKRDIKTGVMQELLTGERRLPGFRGKWDMKQLGHLGSTYGGLSGKTKADFGDGSARYIPFLNVLNNVSIDLTNLEAVRVSASERQNYVLKGDLFFNGSSETPEEVGMCSVLLDDVKNVFLNSFCFGFRFRDGASTDGLYLAYFFRSGQGREMLLSLAQGATRYNLSKRSLLRLEFAIPTLDEQTAIASVLSDLDAEIVALEARRDKARSLKQGMMQQLLTGSIRLT